MAAKHTLEKCISDVSPRGHGRPDLFPLYTLLLLVRIHELLVQTPQHQCRDSSLNGLPCFSFCGVMMVFAASC